MKISKIMKLLQDVDRTHNINVNKGQEDFEQSRISVSSGDMLEGMKNIDEHLEERGMDEIYEENLKGLRIRRN
ncbi:unnamed protein product [Paramecium octaurelia]|uniref:Uncharacterized protein n=1 Tax=Paramecium octaurelia TaxID=43137 RepID=A0A8S1WRL0_PAROT|nr:unnamed protein product [Paramecium octaurelia]